MASDLEKKTSKVCQTCRKCFNFITHCQMVTFIKFRGREKDVRDFKFQWIKQVQSHHLAEHVFALQHWALYNFKIKSLACFHIWTNSALIIIIIRRICVGVDTKNIKTLLVNESWSTPKGSRASEKMQREH